MANGVESDPKPEEPFESLAEDIVEMINFRPPSPDNRATPFELDDDELRYLYGETDEVPEFLED